MIEARKIHFQEAWDSSGVFLVDEELERELKAEVEALLETARDQRVSEAAEINVADIDREIKGISQAARRIRYKESLIGSYEDRKKQKVDGRIRTQLEEIKAKHGLTYTRVHPMFVKANIGLFAVPSFEDAWVVIVGSFQETTSIDQITKEDYMMSAYERVSRVNSRNSENRAFVNFVDGGGWLARKRDLERLVVHCHYFINLQHLDMLEAIVLQDVPERYFT